MHRPRQRDEARSDSRADKDRDKNHDKTSDGTDGNPSGDSGDGIGHQAGNGKQRDGDSSSRDDGGGYRNKGNRHHRDNDDFSKKKGGRGHWIDDDDPGISGDGDGAGKHHPRPRDKGVPSIPRKQKRSGAQQRPLAKPGTDASSYQPSRIHPHKTRPRSKTESDCGEIDDHQQDKTGVDNSRYQPSIRHQHERPRSDRLHDQPGTSRSLAAPDIPDQRALRLGVHNPEM